MEQPDDYSEYNLVLWKPNGSIFHYPKAFLDFDFLEEEFEYIMFLKFESLPEFPKLDIPELVRALDSIFVDDQNTFVLITPRKPPPLYKESLDESICSFSCSFSRFKGMMKAIGQIKFYSAHFLFILLDHVFQGKSGYNKIIIKQIPIQVNKILNINHCAVIIPHRGDNGYLGNLLYFLKQLNQLNIYVGLDQEVTKEIEELKQKYSDTLFYTFSPNPVGPYVIRNRLIDKSIDQLICFQDSDDIPCADRFERLSDYMIKTDCQLCGSHEVKMDYYTETIQAVRYPADVMVALEKGAGHSLLHPSSIMTRNAFYLGGKLSEEHCFGNDTKFLYHNYFVLDNIRNIDEFLYIRRKHADSLTTSAETCIGSTARNHLLSIWVREFDRVKCGMLELENSGLVYKSSKFKLKVKRL